MKKTYMVATKYKQVAKDIVRAAKQLKISLFYKLNKQQHRMEFKFEATSYDLQQMNALLKAFRTAREDAALHQLEMANHIYG